MSLKASSVPALRGRLQFALARVEPPHMRGPLLIALSWAAGAFAVLAVLSSELARMVGPIFGELGMSGAALCVVAGCLGFIAVLRVARRLRAPESTEAQVLLLGTTLVSALLVSVLATAFAPTGAEFIPISVLNVAGTAVAALVIAVTIPSRRARGLVLSSIVLGPFVVLAPELIWLGLLSARARPRRRGGAASCSGDGARSRACARGVPGRRRRRSPGGGGLSHRSRRSARGATFVPGIARLRARRPFGWNPLMMNPSSTGGAQMAAKCVLVSDGQICWTCERAELVAYLEAHGWRELVYPPFASFWTEPDEEAYEKLCLHVPPVHSESQVTEEDEELPEFGWFPHLRGWALMSARVD